MSDPFEILHDELVRVAAHRHPRRMAQRRSRVAVMPARSRTWLRRPLVVAIALVGASASAGGLALAGTFSGGTISPQAWVNGQRVTPETQMTPEQTADLAILRRPRVASDALPTEQAQPLTDSPGLGGEGVNPALSRRAQGFDSGAAWVIPGNDGTICLVTDNAQALTMLSEPQTPNSPPTRVPGANGSAGCATAAVINQSGWWAGYGGTADTPGMLFTAGIVPDGVTSVIVNLVGGATIPLPIHDNVFMGEIHALTSSVAGQGAGSPLSVTYDGSNGPVTLGG
jgi:hypothetical protein